MMILYVEAKTDFWVYYSILFSNNLINVSADYFCY